MEKDGNRSVERDELLARAQKAMSDNVDTPNPVNRQQPSPLVKMITNVLAFVAQLKYFLTTPFRLYKRYDDRYYKRSIQVISNLRQTIKPLHFFWFFSALFSLYLAATAIYFYGTQFEELVYTTGKQEIETGEQYQFTGCTSLPCSTQADNGKYYKIESSYFFPALYYPEEDVFANIPQQDGVCLAKGYGFYFRGLRSLYKYFQWYQKVYDISCRPYTEQEKKQAIDSGVIAP